MKRLTVLCATAVTLCLGACAEAPPPEAGEATSADSPAPPPTTAALDAGFLSRASIYEVNVRQFSAAGTLAQVTRQLPRLDALGVDILWLMPIQPIGEAKRKGPLGSYYSIRDYTAVNPEFGTLEDVKALVTAAHAQGQLVILDWVANHTAWDHPWIDAQPDYYTTDAQGNIVDPVNPETGESWGWTDVADLNYGNEALWPAMVDAMAFWLRETEMDGFRCDVAGEVPTAFWEYARPRLEAIRPVFMLAEAEKPELAELFDMSYGWHFHHVMNGIAAGTESVDAIDSYMRTERTRFPAEHTMMMFTTNHDENSWSGTVFERYGDAHQAFAVLAFTLDGMPLLYSGQEAGLDRRLEFFSADPIDWRDYSLETFYRDLVALKDAHAALTHGADGGRFVALETSATQPKAYAFGRRAAGSDVVVALNFGDTPTTLSFAQGMLPGRSVVFGEATADGDRLSLAPFGYAVLSE
ncbi:MAG: alpha-amylase family glycosyl hydrolase [Pseudomonadota bacterium]